MPLSRCARPALALLFVLSGCTSTPQVVSDTREAGEWRKRADYWQGRYDEMEKQVGQLLDILPLAAEEMDTAALKETLHSHQRLPDLVARLERQIAQARDAKESGDRYRLVVRCGGEKDDGHYSVGLQRRAGKRGKGGRIKLIDRTYCPSSGVVEIAPPQLSAGEYQLLVAFESAPGRPYHFSFALHHYDPEGHDEVVCAAETGPSGPPLLSNACDIALRLTPPSDLPVAR